MDTPPASLHRLIRERRSPRAFDAARTLEPGALTTLLEAARWAPSSFNEQPWRFLVATRSDRAPFDAMLTCLAEPNRKWAQDAQVLLISATSLTFARNAKPNAHAHHDLGLAVSQLTLQATALGLAVHQMAGFDPARARETFSIPAGFEAVTAMALGYAPKGDLPAARTRKTLGEIAFAGAWDRPANV